MSDCDSWYESLNNCVPAVGGDYAVGNKFDDGNTIGGEDSSNVKKRLRAALPEVDE